MSLIIPHSEHYVVFCGGESTDQFGILENHYMSEASINFIGASVISDPSALPSSYRYVMGIFLVNPIRIYDDRKDQVLEQALTACHTSIPGTTPTEKLRILRSYQSMAAANRGVSDLRIDQYPFSYFFGGHFVERDSHNSNMNMFGVLTDLSTLENVMLMRTSIMLLQTPSVVVCTYDASGNADTITVQVFSGTKDSESNTNCAYDCMHDFVAMASDILHGVKRINAPDGAHPITGLLAPSHFNTVLENRPEYTRYGIIGWTHPRDRFIFSRKRMNGFLDAINDRMKGGTDAELEDDQTIAKVLERSEVFNDNYERYTKTDNCDPIVFLLREAERHRGFSWRIW